MHSAVGSWPRRSKNLIGLIRDSNSGQLLLTLLIGFLRFGSRSGIEMAEKAGAPTMVSCDDELCAAWSSLRLNRAAVLLSSKWGDEQGQSSRMRQCVEDCGTGQPMLDTMFNAAACPSHFGRMEFQHAREEGVCILSASLWLRCCPPGRPASAE